MRGDGSGKSVAGADERDGWRGDLSGRSVAGGGGGEGRYGAGDGDEVADGNCGGWGFGAGEDVDAFGCEGVRVGILRLDEEGVGEDGGDDAGGGDLLTDVWGDGCGGGGLDALDVVDGHGDGAGGRWAGSGVVRVGSSGDEVRGVVDVVDGGVGADVRGGVDGAAAGPAPSKQLALGPKPISATIVDPVGQAVDRGVELLTMAILPAVAEKLSVLPVEPFPVMKSGVTGRLTPVTVVPAAAWIR